MHRGTQKHDVEGTHLDLSLGSTANSAIEASERNSPLVCEDVQEVLLGLDEPQSPDCTCGFTGVLCVHVRGCGKRAIDVSEMMIEQVMKQRGQETKNSE